MCVEIRTVVLDEPAVYEPVDPRPPRKVVKEATYKTLEVNLDRRQAIGVLHEMIDWLAECHGPCWCDDTSGPDLCRYCWACLFSANWPKVEALLSGQKVSG